MFVAFNGILVLWNIFLKYYMFLRNTIVRLFFAWLVWRLLFLFYHVACCLFYQDKYFFSVYWNSGYSFVDIDDFLTGFVTFDRGKLLTEKVTTANSFSARQFSSTMFDVSFSWKDFFGLLSFRNCKFSNFKQFLRKICNARIQFRNLPG